MVFTLQSLLDMQDATHITMTLDIDISFQWVDSFLDQGCKVNQLRNNNSFQEFNGRYPDLIPKYQRSVRDMLNDSFP